LLHSVDDRPSWSYTLGMKKIAIIYQDHHLLVVNKPAGVVIHPTYKHPDGTMWNTLLAVLEAQGGDDWRPPELPDRPEWAAAPEDVKVMLREKRRERLWKEEGLLPRPCLLHRLDKDTSGVVALARSERACRHFIRQFEERTVVKRYFAVVQSGAPDWSRPRTTFMPSFLLSPGDEFVLDGPLQRDPDDRRRCIVGPQGRQATTYLKALAVEGDLALLEVQPVTGRTHQIRAHLAALGHAIVGDQIYAPGAEAGTLQAALKRQFLHAYSLQLRHYPDNAVRTFVAPLADDLRLWMKQYSPALWQAWHNMEEISQ
jgi:23S rRNA pseudouridine1911/1915/1917 synthase